MPLKTVSAKLITKISTYGKLFPSLMEVVAKGFLKLNHVLSLLADDCHLSSDASQNGKFLFTVLCVIRPPVIKGF